MKKAKESCFELCSLKGYLTSSDCGARGPVKLPPTPACKDNDNNNDICRQRQKLKQRLKLSQKFLQGH